MIRASCCSRSSTSFQSATATSIFLFAFILLLPARHARFVFPFVISAGLGLFCFDAQLRDLGAPLAETICINFARLLACFADYFHAASDFGIRRVLMSPAARSARSRAASRMGSFGKFCWPPACQLTYAGRLS